MWTVDEYDASSREVIEMGTLFNYRDPDTGEWMHGYYDRPTRLFTAVTDDEARIATHFRCPEVCGRPAGE